MSGSRLNGRVTNGPASFSACTGRVFKPTNGPGYNNDGTWTYTPDGTGGTTASGSTSLAGLLLSGGLFA